MSTLPFGYQFAAGAITGISEICMMYPLDTVKTRMQLTKTMRDNVISEHKRDNQQIIKTLTSIIKKEGLFRLYSGLISPILMETPKRALKFASNDFFQQLYQSISNSSQINQPISIMAGASAGMVESFVVVPFELVKIRLQNPLNSEETFGRCLKNIVQSKGISGLMLGWEPTVWRHLIWNAGYFGMIFQMNSLLDNYFPNSTSGLNKMISGALGGSLSCFLSIPFDVVKTRIQNGNLKGSLKDPWSWQVMRVIQREEGISALYKGIKPVLVRMGPSGAYLYITYTTLTEYIQHVLEN